MDSTIIEIQENKKYYLIRKINIRVSDINHTTDI